MVKQMQPEGHIKNAWIMFEHVKQVRQWTTMACHVNDYTYYRVMTIVCCDMQFVDIDTQMVFLKNLNVVMERQGVERPYFKESMADTAQTNWNVVRVVYENGKKEDRMDN